MQGFIIEVIDPKGVGTEMDTILMINTITKEIFRSPLFNELYEIEDEDNTISLTSSDTDWEYIIKWDYSNPSNIETILYYYGSNGKIQNELESAGFKYQDSYFYIKYNLVNSQPSLNKVVSSINKTINNIHRLTKEEPITKPTLKTEPIKKEPVKSIPKPTKKIKKEVPPSRFMSMFDRIKDL